MFGESVFSHAAAVGDGAKREKRERDRGGDDRGGVTACGS